MKITCGDLTEFIERLRSEAPSAILRGEVNLSISRRPIGGTRFTAAKFEVGYLATAIIDFENGQYLLEVGEYCGNDYTDQGGCTVGTDNVESVKRELVAACAALGLKLRPGALQL